MNRDELNGLSEQIIAAACHVHSQLGPGMLESAYTVCLVYELRKRGHMVHTEVPVPVVYDDQKMADVGYRLDLLVDREVVVEVKSLESLAPVHFAQLVSYLKMTNRRLGLLINFNVERLMMGLHRRVNNF